jgi:MFS family permease
MTEKPYAAIPKSLYAAMAVQFAVGGAVIPFVSMLLRDRGLDFSAISRILLASSSTLLVFPFLWGMLADRYLPINRLFTLLNVLAAACLVLFLSQKTFIGMLVAFTGFYACFNPTLMLMNALSFHHLENPKEQFAGVRSWGSIGWIVPSLPIYLWLVLKDDPRLDVTLKVGLAFAFLMVLISTFLPHTPPGARGTRAGLPGAPHYWQAVKRLLKDSNYVVILISFFLMAGSSSILMFYSPPFMEDRGVNRAWIGPIQCIGVVLEILLFPWLPRLIKRWKYTASILVGCLSLVLRHLLFARFDNPWILSLSYLLAGMVIVFFNIGSSILVNSIAGLEVRATAQTLLMFFGSGMGPMFANWMAGHLARGSHGNLRPVFIFAAILAGCAALLIALRGSKLNHIQPPQRPRD